MGVWKDTSTYIIIIIIIIILLLYEEAEGKSYRLGCYKAVTM